MKLIRCNGKELEVRTVGPVIYRLKAGAVPIKLNGWRVLDDDEARKLVAEMKVTGLYHAESSDTEDAERGACIG